MIPKSLQPVLWSADIAKLDLKKDKTYIIHQILAYGRRQDLKWLLATYQIEQIKQVFIEHPAKDYTPAAFSFITNYLLGLENSSINKKNYVRSFPRHT